MRQALSPAEPVVGVRRRANGRSDAVVLGLVLCLPIPLLAATGLTLPLPTGVVEAIVAIVPGGGDAATRVAAPGAAGDDAPVLGAPEPVTVVRATAPPARQAAPAPAETPARAAAPIAPAKPASSAPVARRAPAPPARVVTRPKPVAVVAQPAVTPEAPAPRATPTVDAAPHADHDTIAATRGRAATGRRVSDGPHD